MASPVRAGPEIPIPPPTCADPGRGSELEWWLGNGLGGYASGTVSGVLTRRYHGLLAAPLEPPTGRWLLLAKADAVLVDGDREIPIHTNRWAGDCIDPEGCRLLTGFSLERGLPVWCFDVGDLRIEQRVWMSWGENRTQVAWRWSAGTRERVPRIRIALIGTPRDHHRVNGGDAGLIAVQATEDGLRIPLPGGRFVQIRGPGAQATPDATWIERFDLPIERERGMEDQDRHQRLGWLELPLERGCWVGLSCALDVEPETDLAASLAAEQSRLDALQSGALPGIDPGEIPPWIRQLVNAAGCYRFRRTGSGGGRASVIAGFPWFGDWGRDTMIALPGLTLATGRPALGREILLAFSGQISGGMLPNFFPGRGDVPEYNTVDAALWLIEAWRGYCAATGDLDALASVYPALESIIHAYRDGTRFGIRLDPADGLIAAGADGQQLTWMDAKVGDLVVTPRRGKPVEINALWYNALRSLAALGRRLGRASDELDRLAVRAGKGFRRFERCSGAGLYDVLDGPDGDDPAIRPNQIFAVSLPHSPIRDSALRRAILEECRAHLLTPVGLRSLSPHDPKYIGRYLGDRLQRDRAYHQGTVWAWLLGPFAIAEYRITGDARSAMALLAPIASHLAEAGIGQVSEIFDGDPPHRPRGIPAQAWSVACALDTWWRLMLAASMPERNEVPENGET